MQARRTNAAAATNKGGGLCAFTAWARAPSGCTVSLELTFKTFQKMPSAQVWSSKQDGPKRRRNPKWQTRKLLRGDVVFEIQNGHPALRKWTSVIESDYMKKNLTYIFRIPTYIFKYLVLSLSFFVTKAFSHSLFHIIIHNVLQYVTGFNLLLHYILSEPWCLTITKSWLHNFITSP